ncbi:MAG: TolC family protein [Firmicutes bacterium]|nr:TolC family protein [Bacillota bacterium]
MANSVPARSWIVLMIAWAVLASVWAVPAALAQDAAPDMEAASGENPAETLRLTLEEAVELALAYDLEHEIARLNWENARIDSRIAQASGPASAYDRLQQELEERRAENTYQTARRTLVMDVVEQYLNLKQAERQREIARRELAVAREELAIVREMVRIGERHAQDERREENRVAGLELSADAAARAYETQLREFLARLGLPENAAVELVDEPELLPFDWDLDATLAYAQEHAFAVWEREASLRMAAMDLEALRVQDPPPLQLEKAENEYRIAELNALQAERSFANDLRSAYYTLMDAARQYDSAAVDLELAQAAYDVARRQHEAGLSTDLDWAQAEIELLDAERAYYDSLYAYVTVRLELLNLIGHPLDFGEDSPDR